MAYKREATWSKELRQKYATSEAPVRGNVKSEPTGMSRVSVGELRVGNGKNEDRPRVSWIGRFVLWFAGFKDSTGQ